MKLYFLGVAVGFAVVVAFVFGYYRGMKAATKMGKKALNELAAHCAKEAKAALKRQHDEYMAVIRH